MDGAVIVGGGPAGAAAAILLAEAGVPVTVVERSAGPADKVCGDFLSAEAVETVRRLGVDLDRLGPAPVGRVRVLHGGSRGERRAPVRGLGHLATGAR